MSKEKFNIITVPHLCCAFCYRFKNECEFTLAGPQCILICDRCIEASSQMLLEFRNPTLKESCYDTSKSDKK